MSWNSIKIITYGCFISLIVELLEENVALSVLFSVEYPLLLDLNLLYEENSCFIHLFEIILDNENFTSIEEIFLVCKIYF